MFMKITPVAFLIIFFLPVFSVYFLFNVRKAEIYNAIQKILQSGVDESRLVLLKIPLSEEKYGDFQRTEDNEFRYKGKMYDVSKSEKHGDTTYYWAIWDVEETELESEMKDATAKASGSDGYNESTKESISLFLEELFIQIDHQKFHLPVTDNASWAVLPKIIHLNRAIAPPTPPPEI